MVSVEEFINALPNLLANHEKVMYANNQLIGNLSSRVDVLETSVKVLESNNNQYAFFIALLIFAFIIIGSLVITNYLHIKKLENKRSKQTKLEVTSNEG